MLDKVKMKLNKNKKAQIAEGLLWIARIFFLIVPLILAIAFFVNNFVMHYDVTKTEAFILSERADTCFSQESGVIDLNKFNSDELEKCYSFKPDEAAIKLTLTFSDQSKSEAVGKTDLFPLCGIKQGHVPYCNDFRKYILVKSGNEFYPGALDINIALIK
ncbi:hypothetical protein B6U80_01660 [Candidatus Pacearchaeota archaeon ex4484_26]|nr:MAG: hypothetical protein B6U80_01660 [Candidatus Pacearchaeota archaeon ex4484_26]